MTTSTRWTGDQLNGFHNAAQSLKLYRRAELHSDKTGESLIQQLYVDPLPNEHVLNTVLKPNTTMLIGRKGTGKSTIFQKAQYDLRSMVVYTSAYIDIKTVFESSQVDPTLFAKIELMPTALPRESLERLMLYRSFLKAIIGELRNELEKRIRGSLWNRIKNRFSGTLDELLEGLDGILDDAESVDLMSVTGISNLSTRQKSETAEESTFEAATSLTVGGKPEMKGSLSAKDTSKHVADEEKAYADVLMRVFNIKEFILRLKNILSKAGIKHLFVFVDDFSELPHDAMKIVVDTLLAPLNNWSEELIKFKIAAYPGRIYYGDIDKTKIDEVSLDLYALYGSNDVTDMEEKAIAFTRRLVERRLAHYCHIKAEDFFEGRQDDIWRNVFYATMANPRTLGYILFYLHESHLIYDRPISLRAIHDSAQRYYEGKIESYFPMAKFLHETFDERSSIFSLKELLETIVGRARELRGYRGSAVTREIKGRVPSSHFHVLTSLESLLATLELNFFITKYYEMSDRDARKVSVFALNYGLCQKYTIEFGRPSGKREHRLYFVERIFDYSPLIQKYVKTNQEIICDQCGVKQDSANLAALRFYGMRCPACGAGQCHVVNLSRKYEPILRAVQENQLLPKAEIGILQTLRSERRPLYARDIAEELDCSYQLVGKRGKNLADRGLVDRSTNDQGRRVFSMTNTAEQAYFAHDSLSDSLILEPKEGPSTPEKGSEAGNS